MTTSVEEVAKIIMGVLYVFPKSWKIAVRFKREFPLGELARYKKDFLSELRTLVCPKCASDFALKLWETKKHLSAIARMSRDKVQIQNDPRVTEKHWTEVRTEITAHSKCCQCDYYTTKKRVEVTKENESETTY